ncbi:alcohol dehydrogenase catalytic domain-containing protein [Streptomyces cacaoi]|uniref:alcohol dehydrogenase catalytic domain-containing protein n=1 Tax=Streptomyces cacaoi TaxID=1898 RepID=UPI003F4CBD61
MCRPRPCPRRQPARLEIRNGYLAEMLPLPLPVVIGSDTAGTVLEVGDGVGDLSAEDPVAGFADSGAVAAVAVTRRECLTKIRGSARRRWRVRRRGSRRRGR